MDDCATDPRAGHQMDSVPGTDYYRCADCGHKADNPDE